jgi:hypothetical protein
MIRKWIRNWLGITSLEKDLSSINQYLLARILFKKEQDAQHETPN